MKQLYATGLLNQPTAALNDEFGRVRQPALRASTAGLRPEELETALTLLSYSPPQRTSEAIRPLPIRLALFNTPTTGRMLTHTAPNGGSYFAHTLLNVPATADAQLAIQTWGSPLWQRHEPHSNGDLPELPYLPVSDQLDDTNLREWLQTPLRRELLEFVLTALLGTPDSTRIFLAASSEDVARVVYAVTRAMPQGLLDDFTFSTYEAEPLNCAARLIGCELGEEQQDLPETCYGLGNVAFNATTSRRSEISQEVPFATFAVKALSNGEHSSLDELKSIWQRLGLKEARQWDLVYRMARGTGVLTQEEAAEALQHPPMAAWIATRADALNQFLEWALDSREFASTSFSRAAQALRQKTDTLNKVAQTVREQGLKALKAGELGRVANAFEVILPVVAPSKANAIWGEILGQISNPAELSWELRWYLLPRLVRFKQAQENTAVDTALTPWISVPAEKLSELLALDLPKPYQIAASRAGILREAELSSTFIRTVGEHPALSLTLLRPTDDVKSDHCVKLFEGLLEQLPQYPWLEDLLNHASDYPADLLNRFFETALSAGRVDAERLIRAQGPRLLELFAGQTGLDRVGTMFLANPPADLLHQPSLLGFLAKLREEPLVTQDLIDRVRHVETLRRFLDKPELTSEAMKPIAVAFRVTPAVLPVNTKNEVFEAVTGELLRQANRDEFQANLESVLLELGSTLATDASDLFENLLRAIRGRTDFARHENLVPTFLALALGAARSSELAGKLDGLDSHAFAIAAEAAKRGGNQQLRIIDNRAETWPKQAKTQWGFLSAAVRPRGLCGLLRDAGLVAIGAVLASAAWGIWSLVK
jgi:hypothetical protein